MSYRHTCCYEEAWCCKTDRSLWENNSRNSRKTV